MRHFSQHVSRRRGLTLIELVLVLALLVIIAALVLPNFFAPLRNQSLRKSGDLVRSELARARIQAMRTGQIQMFRYVSGSGVFQIEPYFTEQDSLEVGLNTPFASGMGTVPQVAGSGTRVRELPSDVTFLGSVTSQDARAQFLSGSSSMPSPTPAIPGGMPGMGAAGGFSEPLVFYPDGTSSDARMVLTNGQNRFVVIQLRGLTGLARVSRLLTGEELQP